MPNRTVLMVDGKPVAVTHEGQLSDDDRDALQIFIRESWQIHQRYGITEIEITEVTCPTRI